HVAHEPGIDLEHVDRQGLQVGQHGVTGAEIVDGDLHTNFLELRQGVSGGFDVVHHGAFGDLQAHRSGVDSELADRVGDAFRKTTTDQLYGRHIDAQHGAVPDAVGAPPAEVGAGAAHHPPAQRRGQVGRFGHTDERVGQQQPPNRVPPAHQRLRTHDGAGPQVDLGQVMQEQTFAFDVALQV